MFYAISSLVDMITECYEVTVTVYWQFTTDTKNNLKWGLRKPHQVFTGSPPTFNLVDKYKSTSYRSIRLNSGRINSLALNSAYSNSKANHAIPRQQQKKEMKHKYTLRLMTIESNIFMGVIGIEGISLYPVQQLSLKWCLSKYFPASVSPPLTPSSIQPSPTSYQPSSTTVPVNRGETVC